MADEIILLVEDNPDHATLVQALLEYRGLVEDIYVTEGVAEAKSYLLGEWPFDDPDRTPAPTLVILDHWLEDGTGLELLEWLRDTPGVPDVPVLVFTGCRDPEVREKALSLGAREFFIKPEGFETLGSVIEELLMPQVRRGTSKGKEGEEDSSKAG